MVHIKNNSKDTNKSLKKSLYYTSFAIAFAFLGFLSQNYMSDITNFIKITFQNLKVFISNFIIPINDMNILTIIFLLIALVLLVKATLSIKGLLKKDNDKNLFSRLPNNYHLFSNFIIDNNSIPNILICPKGIYTIHSNKVITSRDNSFLIVKQSILQSKVVNDFMQKNSIGNYYVKTIVTLDEVNDKVKQYFPEICVSQQDKLQEYLDSQETKYSDAECKRIAMQLKEVITSENQNTSSKNMSGTKNQKSKV